MNAISSKFLLIVGALITLFLFVFTQFESYLDLELIFAPLIVITLLNYSDEIFVHTLIHPLKFVVKLWNRVV